MTRKEEIQEKAKSLYYHFCVRETCKGDEDDCTNCPYGKVIEPLVSMAKWADQHPRKGLVDIEKACEWLKDNARDYTYDDYDNLAYIQIHQFIKDFKKAMEE